MTAYALTAVALLAAGYVLGRWRPAHRAWKWANRVDSRLAPLGPARRHRPAWWLAQAVFAVSIAAAFAQDPAHVLRLWRHRNDPPPPRSPAVGFRDTVTTPEEAYR